MGSVLYVGDLDFRLEARTMAICDSIVWTYIRELSTYI